MKAQSAAFAPQKCADISFPQGNRAIQCQPETNPVQTQDMQSLMGSSKTTSFWVRVGLAFKFKWELIPSLITKKNPNSSDCEYLWFSLAIWHLPRFAQRRWYRPVQGEAPRDRMAWLVEYIWGWGDYLGSVFNILYINITHTSKSSNLLDQNKRIDLEWWMNKIVWHCQNHWWDVCRSFLSLSFFVFFCGPRCAVMEYSLLLST